VLAPSFTASATTTTDTQVYRDPGCGGEHPFYVAEIIVMVVVVVVALQKRTDPSTKEGRIVLGSSVHCHRHRQRWRS
jgi:hypothetical protein